MSPWCLSFDKRAFDVIVSVLLLASALPLLALIAALVKASSRGPVLFRQRRVGRHGREFWLLKFRTMSPQTLGGPGLTRAGDPRVTAAGRFLRRWKFDEWPQLFNVLRGEMSLVGPRPDLAEFVLALRPEQSSVLQLRPGMTGAASLQFRNEEQVLAQVPTDGLTDYYLTCLLPQKVNADLKYARRASLWTDCWLLLKTAGCVFLSVPARCEPFPSLP